MTVAPPLEGIKVIRLGTAPVTERLCRLLEEQGAKAFSLADLAGRIADADVLLTAGDGDPLAEAGIRRPLDRQLIHCHIPAFSPERGGGGGRVADSLVAAELGLYRSGSGAPRGEPLPIATGLAAILAAIHVAAAIRIRQNGGGGQSLVVPMSSAVMMLLGQALTRPLDVEVPDAYGTLRLPMYDVYRCSDGRWILVHLTSTQFADILLSVADKPAWRPEMLSAMAGLPDEDAVQAWRQRLANLFGERPSTEWEELITSRGGGCTPCLAADEWLRTPQALAIKAMHDNRNNCSGVPVVIIRPTSEGGSAVGDRIAAVADPAAPLAGLRVIDLGLVIAGPVSGRTLGELGAEVVKVDGPGRPPRDLKTWLEVSRGKRSILIDLKQAAGREVLWRLLEGADVLVENFRAGKLASLGFDPTVVAHRLPHLVIVSVRAFGHAGPWTNRPGWEHSAQAATGMMIFRSACDRPEPFALPLTDYGTGLLGAFGALLALIQRDRTGRGGQVQCSLTQTATFLLGTDRGGPPIIVPEATLVDGAEGWLAVDPANVGANGQLNGDGRAISAPVRELDQLPEVDWLARVGALVQVQHPRLGAVRQVIASVAAETYRLAVGHPAPDPGRDTIAMLRELDYAAVEIDELLKSGAVAERPA